MFYDNHLISVQSNKVDFRLCNSSYFPETGGVLYNYTSDFTNGIISSTGLNIVSTILNAINENYPKRSIAIISPFKDSVKQLQKSFLTDTCIENLTIETIDRIQGMTVDYAILYIPGRNPGFALDERRFNVATSRSRSTTLIVSDIPLTTMHSITPTVSAFVEQCIQMNQTNKTIQSSDDIMIQSILENNDIKALYPGLENIVDQLLNNNIPFSKDGETELTNDDGVVVASAGMILDERKIVIDPIDDKSKYEFIKQGYDVLSSKDFDINKLR